MDELMTTKEVAALLRLRPTSVTRLRAQGKLPPAIYISERWVRYRRRDIEAWLAERTGRAA